MHLLNTSTLQLRNFVKSIPSYAILSHTWGDEEVTFDDVDKAHTVNLRGYEKLKQSCAQALEDGFEWIWVDTCCINKTSSAELSEAINSMYNWYWGAEICYAYLSDVPDRHLTESEWFRRGWTLQELLAPAVVEFYKKDWTRIGTKWSLVDDIQEATGIEKKYLLDRRMIKSACVGKKFSWASHRKTTRPKDAAYCMLGLLQVNMPMLYGEGSRAFHRLQLEILKQTRDHTIFVWEPPSNPYDRYSRYKESVGTRRKDMTDNEFWGMLAPSPACFAVHCRKEIFPLIYLESLNLLTHEMTNMGLRITLPCIHRDDNGMLGVLNCRTSEDYCVAVPLRERKGEPTVRIPNAPIQYLMPFTALEDKLIDMFVEAETLEDAITAWDPYILKVGSIQLWDSPKEGFGTPQLVSSTEGPSRPPRNIIEPTMEELEEEKAVRLPVVQENVKDGIMLDEQNCGAVCLSIGSTALAIVLGHQQHFTYLKLVSCTADTNIIQELEKCEEGMQSANNNKETSYLRDYMEEEVGDLTVTVSIKRSHWQASPCWKLAILIWITAMGRPGPDNSTHRPVFEV